LKTISKDLLILLDNNRATQKKPKEIKRSDQFVFSLMSAMAPHRVCIKIKIRSEICLFNRSILYFFCACSTNYFIYI